MYARAERAIESALATWSDTPIFFDGQHQKQLPTVTFLRVQFDWPDASMAGIGRVRATGYVLISCFCPKYDGAGRYSAQVLSKVNRLLLTADYGEVAVTARPGFIERVGQRERYYQRNLIVPLEYDVCASQEFNHI